LTPRASIIVTGTEVLTGKVTDRNGPWISERLGELGIDVAEITCIGDRPEDLLSGLRQAAAQGRDLIVTTGGLGPTADDLTAEIVAEFTGRELVLDQAMEAKIAKIIESFAKRLNFDAGALRAANRKQAMVPSGSVAIDPAGTAPGLVVPVSDGLPVIAVLPGPPRELQSMWPRMLETEPMAQIVARGAAWERRSLRLFGIPESEIVKTLREFEEHTDLGVLEITTCLRGFELEIDMRFDAEHQPLAANLVEAIRATHPQHLYSEDGTTVDLQLVDLLQGHKLAVAESCTGGLLAARITNQPGSSSYFTGGVVAYSNEAKRDLLGVPAELLEAHGAVSSEVAEAMAEGALERFGADIACSTTGIAGPEGGTEEKPVGLVHFCVKDSEGRVTARAPVLPGRRTDIQERAQTLALHLIRRHILGEID
jgi:nicotinamide-nucleotide amidase